MRHWRKAIPYLSSKTGKVARFTFADLLGLAVTHELVNSFGVHIATLSAGVDSLFRLLAASGPASLDGAIVFITSIEATLYEGGVEGAGQARADDSVGTVDCQNPTAHASRNARLKSDDVAVSPRSHSEQGVSAATLQQVLAATGYLPDGQP
ncbi:hypothetical protein [Ferrovum myxofaciens]|uniref:hypothetical protein n=1 Tax=Ferrovum myxofaciens TaxID=416213 RepID=UPI001D0D4DE4|nr:hypothetical protein [Ferrovum myxofaciens]